MFFETFQSFSVGFWQMLLFIIIFFAMVIAVGVSAVVGFSVYLKRRPKSLKSDNQTQFAELPPNRSLFTPADEEIRAFEREENAAMQAKEREEARRLAAEKIEKVHDCEKIWRISPDKRKTIELLRLSSESENAETFSKIAESVIKVWCEKQIENLTADDLADLLDSHLRTLPQQERTSGAIFWLKQEITDLRLKSEL
ncbi:MAG: hypothetical protein ACR2MG_04425 [Pyrinomonadaceae bacterium]